MSENMQSATCDINSVPKPVVRSALIRAPIELLQKSDRQIQSRLGREIGLFRLPRFSETQMSFETYLDIVDRVSFLGCGAEQILEAGLRPDLPSIGLFGKVGVYAPTVWDAVASLRDGFGYFMSSVQITSHFKRGRCQIVFDPGTDIDTGLDANTQYLLALLVYLLRQASKPVSTGLRLTYPGAKSVHFRVFPEAVGLRNGPICIVDFDEALLRSPMTTSNARQWLISKHLLSVFENVDLDSRNLPQLIREMQISSLKSGHCPISLEETGLLLDLPVRTVQARLKAGKSSFAEIRNGVLHDGARTALLNGLSISETSALLGFAQRQNFSEAFSKWQGQSPSEFTSQSRLESVS